MAEFAATSFCRWSNLAGAPPEAILGDGEV